MSSPVSSANSSVLPILVVGAGPAGSTAAFFLAKAGFEVKVVERSESSFSYGQGIDVTGFSISILKQMGVYEEVKTRSTGEKGFSICDDAEEIFAQFGVSEDENGSGFTLTQQLEIMRGDLTQILATAAKQLDRVEFSYGCTVTQIEQFETHVSVCVRDIKLQQQHESNYQFVIGADGIMSSVRDLAFDSEVTKNCFKSIEQYTAFFSMPGQSQDIPNALLQHGPGRRAILIRPVKSDSIDRSSCYLVYTNQSSKLENMLQTTSGTPPSRQDQKAIFADIFDDFPGSFRDRALEGMNRSKDFYLAQSAQIKLPTWSNRRIVLSGDSAFAPSPATGQGTSLAIVGSYIIAGEVAKCPSDPAVAFQEYERIYRDYVTEVQKIPGGTLLPRLANPQSVFGITVLRWSFWLISWFGLSKLINTKRRDTGFEVPYYPG